MKRWALFSALALVTSALDASPAWGAAPDGTTAGVYIVQMDGDPVVAHPDTAPAPGRKVDPESSAVRRHVGRLGAAHASAVSAAGAPADARFYDYHFSFNGFAAVLTPAQAQRMAAVSGVRGVTRDSRRMPRTDNTPEFLGLSTSGGLWEGTGAGPVLGEGVIVGVVDTGIWPEHPSFSDQTDLTFRPGASGKRSLAYGAPPAGWHGKCQGGEKWSMDHCNNKLIGARYFVDGFSKHGVVAEDYISARDADGHGTHTASTAAGNAGVPARIFGGSFGDVSGMAPRARVAMYKACWNDQGCFVTDLVAAIDAAVSDGVDVVNYSIGSNVPSITGPDEIAFLFAARAGIFVAASNGNAGPGAGTGGSPASSPWLTAVGASTQNRTFQGSVALGNGASFAGASVTSGTDVLPIIDAAAAGSELCVPGELAPSAVAGRIVLCRRGVIARVEKSLAVKQAGGLGVVLYNASDTQPTQTDNHYLPTVHVSNTDGLAVKLFISDTADATARIVGGTFAPAQGSSMADFSSRGPNGAAPDIIKPDVTAPGVNVLAGASPTPFLGADGQLFQSISGTSMSSPHVAGVAALLRQVHPEWTPAMLKSALMTTARQDVTREDGTTPADPLDMGAGHIVPTPAADPGLVYDVGFGDYVRFLCGASSIVSPAACAARGGAIDPSDLNLASIGIAVLAGAQTVTRIVTNVGPAATYTAAVEEPPGVSVSVDPAVLTLAPGESATFRVTFTIRADAAYDEWTFGALTWSDAEHAVRSPLALRPVSFSVPEEIEGSGTSGSRPYDVVFGHSGAFDAAVHGLVPATEHAGRVADDPANDINVALQSGVGITVHEVEISAGARYGRFSLFDDAVDGHDDLDLYVFDQHGNFVGASTGEISEEEVNLLAPASGDYRVIVHGWQTDGPNSNYTLFAWALGDGATRNATIAAPSAAISGATATLVLDWDGLTAGARYLGQVAYRDASDEIGATVVRINA